MRAFGPGRTIERYDVTLDQWESGAAFGDSHVLGPDTHITGIETGVGSGWGGTFRGYVDNVDAGFGADSVSANFEPTPQCTTTCYVDAVNGNDANGGTSAADAKKTIQAAVSQVAAGGTVIVAQGTYAESVTVAKDGVRISGAGKAATVIQGTSCSGNGITLVGSRNGLTVEDLMVTGFENGVYLGVGSDTQTNVTLEDASISSNCRHGIFMQAGTVGNLTVNRVTASSNGTAGSGGRGILVINGVKTNVSITGGTFSGNALSGIDISDGNVSGLTVTGNTVEDNGDAGISVLGARGPGANAISGNTVRNNGRFGIELKASTGTGVESGSGSLVVSGNTVERTLAATDARDHAGIAVVRRSQNPAYNQDQPFGAVVAANVVRGFLRSASGSTGDGFGIVVEGLNNSVRNNTVSNNDVGVQVQGGNTANTQGTAYFDRGDASLGGAVLVRNSITGNGVGFRAVGAIVSPPVSAERNWWGSNTGPAPTGTGDSVVGPVDSDPWLCSGRDTSPAVGFQPNELTSPCSPPPFTVVTPTSLDGWQAANVRADASVSITNAQPRGEAPNNLGSLEFRTNTVTSGQDKADFVKYWGVVPGRTLGNLSALSYEFYRASSSTTGQHHAPVLRLAYSTPSGDSGLLIWENVYNGGSTATPVPTDQWIAKDVLNGNFWMRTYNPGFTVERYDVTLDEWQNGAAYPGSDLLGPDTNIIGVETGVGSGWGGTFRGYVDNVNVQFGTDSESANFEPGPACTSFCYVNGATGNDGNGGASPADAKRTIQAAVTQVSSGGQVIVAAGTYAAGASIAKDGITISGAGTGATVVQGSSCAGNGFTLVGSRNGLTIEDLTVTGFDNGVYLGVIGDTQSNVTVEDVNASANCRHGIFMQAGVVDNLTVNRVTASNNGTTAGSNGRGVWVINGVKTTVSVTEGTFSNNGLTGIDFGDGNVTGLTVTGNTVNGNGDAGISVLGARGPGANRVSGNTVRNNGRFGIEVKASNGSGSDSGSGSLVVSANVVERTVAATDARDSAGIAVIRRSQNTTYNQDQPGGAVVADNEVRGFRRSASGSTGDGFGIVVEGTGNTVRNNVLANNDVGFQVQGGNIANTQGTPFFDRGDAATGGAVANQNSVSANGLGVRALGAVITVPVNAESNWWGSNTGPAPTGTGDSVVGLVDYDPWLCSGADTSAAPGFQPNPQTSPCAAPGSTYTPQDPTRVLDTRNGTGASQAKVGPGGTLRLQVTGPAGSGLAPVGSTAVVLNVTATNATADTYVSVYPTGFAGGPSTSNLNVLANYTIPNLVVSKVAADGSVTLYNDSGSIDLVADLQGSYSSAPTGSTYTPQDPRRLLDTRNGTGAPSAKVGPGGTLRLQVTGPPGSGLAPVGSTAVVLNVTATNASADTYVSVYPTGYAGGPGTSNLNVVANYTIPNLVITKVAADGSVTLYNAAGSVDLIADLQGAYTATTDASAYTPQDPSRVLDTRNGTGAPQSKVGPGGTLRLQVTGPPGSGLAPVGATAVVLNVTATNASADTYISVYPTGYAGGPDTSNLNVLAARTIPNLVITKVAADGSVTLYNDSGSIDLIADLQGAYTQ
nr:right-handed parallel beta-helix repeat-containing protein [Motilibacter deserti]